MKKALLIVVLTLGLVGCSAEPTLTQQDNKYYENVAKIHNELDNSFKAITPILASYIADHSNPQKLNAPAEKFREEVIAAKKKFQAIDPPSGYEDSHKLIIESVGHFQTFSEDLIRLSNAVHINATNGTDPLLYKAKDDFTKAETQYQYQFNIIKQRSGAQ